MRLNDFGSRGTRAKADLEAGWKRCLLRAGRAGQDQVLVNQILKLQATSAKTRGTGIGKVVGHIFQIQLLRFHAAGRRVECSIHCFLLDVPRLDPRQILRRRAVKLVVKNR